MKTIPLESKGLTLERLLEEATDERIVFLSASGETQYVIARADDLDEELLATRSNQELMDYLAECHRRAKLSPRKTLQELRDEHQAESANTAD